MKFASPLVLTLAMALSLVTSIASAQTPEQKARDLMEKFKPTLVVVTVKGKIITKTSGNPLPAKEQQRRTLGITMRDDGLICVSNTAIDAAVGLEGQKAQIDTTVVTIQAAKTEFTDIELSYGDQSVLKGKVVHQDRDADIAFILPDQASARVLNKKFDMVDLKQFIPAEPADQVVGLSRSSSVFGYMPTLVMGRITGVYKKDRTYYVNTAGNSQGMPIFTLDGRPIGITVVRVVDGRPTGILATLSAGSIQIMSSMVGR